MSDIKKMQVHSKDAGERDNDNMIFEFNTEHMLRKQDEIFKLKEKMFSVRFDKTITKDDIVLQLKLLITQLRLAEKELYLIRKDLYSTFEDSLSLGLRGLKMPKYAVSQQHSLYAKDGIVNITKSHNTLGVALKFSLAVNKFISKAKVDGGMQLLVDSDRPKIVASIDADREELLQIRTTLYKFNQKKELNKREQQQKEQFQARLKVLEQKIAEQN
jgi:hypothetical protein